MKRESHDQNMKNLLQDFPKEALNFILPVAMEEAGPVQHIEFVRQEPKKFKLSDSGLKYVYFIDTYAEVSEKERKEIYDKISQQKETIMLAEYIKDIGRKEGIIMTAREDLIDALEIRFGIVQQSIKKKINDIDDPIILKDLFRKAILIKSINEFEGSC